MKKLEGIGTLIGNIPGKQMKRRHIVHQRIRIAMRKAKGRGI